MAHYKDLNDEEQKAFKLVEQKLLTWWYDMQTDPANWKSFKNFWVNNNGTEIKRVLNFLTSNFNKKCETEFDHIFKGYDGEILICQKCDKIAYVSCYAKEIALCNM